VSPGGKARVLRKIKGRKKGEISVSPEKEERKRRVLRKGRKKERKKEKKGGRSRGRRDNFFFLRVSHPTPL
jgi:hypothetical protein